MAATKATSKTSLSLYPKLLQAHLSIDMPDMKRMIGTTPHNPYSSSSNHEERLLETHFGGYANEWTATVKSVGCRSLKATFIRRKLSSPCGTRSASCLEFLQSRFVVEEGKCVITFSNKGEKAKEALCTTGVLVEGGVVCEMPAFSIPEGSCKMEFSVTYSKCSVEIEAVSVPICSADVDNLRVGLRELFNSGKETDFTFTFNKKKTTTIHAHKAVLVAFSPYFEKLIGSGMTETETNSVQIEDADSDTFRCVLKFLYCKDLPQDFDSMALKVLPLADKYLMDDLKRACVHAIRRSLTNLNVCRSLIVADRYRCAGLKKACINKIVGWRSLLNSSMLHELRAFPDLMAELLLTDPLLVNNYR